MNLIGCDLMRYDDAIRLVLWRSEWWLYRGRSFKLDSYIQRQRVSRGCGYWQFAYGNVQHYRMPAKRTIGFSWSRLWA